jgi:hypothetical protein
VHISPTPASTSASPIPATVTIDEPVRASPPAVGGVPGGVTAPLPTVGVGLAVPVGDGTLVVGVPGVDGDDGVVGDVVQPGAGGQVGAGVQPGDVGQVGGGDDGVVGGVVSAAHRTQNILCLSCVGVPFPVSTVSR